MEYFSSETAKGVEFCSYRTDRFKSSLITVSFMVPLCRETASGYSLLTNMLSLATGKYRTMQSLAKVKDELYDLSLDSYVRVRGETLLVTADMSLLADSYALNGEKILEKGMALLGDALFDPCLTADGVFDEHSLESEKKCLIEEINSIVENRHAYSVKRLKELMCKNEPFAADAAGEADRVSGIIPEELMKYYRKCIFEAPVKIVYTGEEEPKEVLRLVKKYLPFGDRENRTFVNTKHENSGTVRRFSETAEGSQSILVIGFSQAETKTSKEKAVLTVFDEIFGNSPQSRLFVNVREKKALCYYCQSYVTANKNVMLVSCGVSGKNASKAEKAILHELKDMQKGRITETEIEYAKKSVIRSLDSIEENLSALNAYILNRSIIGDGKSVDDLKNDVLSVTAEEISGFAESIAADTVFLLSPEALK